MASPSISSKNRYIQITCHLRGFCSLDGHIRGTVNSKLCTLSIFNSLSLQGFHNIVSNKALIFLWGRVLWCNTVTLVGTGISEKHEPPSSGQKCDIGTCLPARVCYNLEVHCLKVHQCDNLNLIEGKQFRKWDQLNFEPLCANLHCAPPFSKMGIKLLASQKISWKWMVCLKECFCMFL
jgi:hypothetical protein